MKCKNCGGIFSDELDKCPYCGTMNKKGAYKKYRQKIRDIIDRVFGLKAEAYNSISKLILMSILRGLLMILIVIGLAYLASRFMRVNYFNDPKYDQEAYDDIMWEEENIDKLNEAFENNDFSLINTLYYQNTRVVGRWSHYDTYCLRKQYQDVSGTLDSSYFNTYELTKVLYFLCDPDYFCSPEKWTQDDWNEYEEDRRQIISRMEEKGYSEQELVEIYETHADEYGYLTASELDKYLKEGN
ncbi:MAG: hypothetical protein IJL85_01140 [Erysipelotrichaceae bacterium]|nr:hypothetical protein [Erysipelotrichaceae bacterium]